MPAAQTFPLVAPRLVVTFHDLTLRRFPQFLPNPVGRLYYWIMTTYAAHRAKRFRHLEFTARDVADAWPGAAARTVVVRNGVAAHFAAGHRTRSGFGARARAVGAAAQGSCQPSAPGSSTRTCRG